MEQLSHFLFPYCSTLSTAAPQCRTRRGVIVAPAVETHRSRHTLCVSPEPDPSLTARTSPTKRHYHSAAEKERVQFIHPDSPGVG
ncbi:hypothetical protein MRX96_026646 [Rhipicephalus microplus]